MYMVSLSDAENSLDIPSWFVKMAELCEGLQFGMLFRKKKCCYEVTAVTDFFGHGGSKNKFENNTLLVC